MNTLLCRYRYDALDLLTGLDPAGHEKQQRFYRHEHLVSELQGGASQSVFQHARHLLAEQKRVAEDFESRLLATDQQRSILRATTPSVRQAYSPFGQRRVESGLGSLLGFNGEVVDPVTGHYLLGNGHRAFNPTLMRFNSPDRLSPFGRGGLNPYAYCLGDPVNFSDPTGRFVDFARLLTSLMSVSNTRLGMSPVIPSYKLAKDALRLGAARQLPFKQAFAATSTVVASGAIFTTGLTGVVSAVMGITGNTEEAKIVAYFALALTGLAAVSRAGTYWAARDPGTEAALKSFVKNKGQVQTATPRPSLRSSSPLGSSTPPLDSLLTQESTEAASITSPPSTKRTVDFLIAQLNRQLEVLKNAKTIRRISI